MQLRHLIRWKLGSYRFTQRVRGSAPGRNTEWNIPLMIHSRSKTIPKWRRMSSGIEDAVRCSTAITRRYGWPGSVRQGSGWRETLVRGVGSVQMSLFEIDSSAVSDCCVCQGFLQETKTKWVRYMSPYFQKCSQSEVIYYRKG